MKRFIQGAFLLLPVLVLLIGLTFIVFSLPGRIFAFILMIFCILLVALFLAFEYLSGKEKSPLFWIALLALCIPIALLIVAFFDPVWKFRP